MIKGTTETILESKVKLYDLYYSKEKQIHPLYKLSPSDIKRHREYRLDPEQYTLAPCFLFMPLDTLRITTNGSETQF